MTGQRPCGWKHVCAQFQLPQGKSSLPSAVTHLFKKTPKFYFSSCILKAYFKQTLGRKFYALRKRLWSNSEAANQPHANLCSQVIHQSIPPAPSPPPHPSPGYCGAFARLVSPGGGALIYFANFALPGGRAFANPGPIPSFWHARGFLSEYNYTEGFTAKKAEWLICQGQE